MKYIEQFVDACMFLGTFDEQVKACKHDYIKALRLYRDYWSERNSASNIELEEFLREFSFNMTREIPIEHRMHSCHAITETFMEYYRAYQMHEKFPANFTIGNVFYKGENIYKASKSDIKKTINSGQDFENTLDIHAWVTVLGYFVIDLTIAPSLFDMGMIEEEEYKDNPVVFWREDIKSNFVYKPLLVDDQFYNRVDEDSK